MQQKTGLKELLLERKLAALTDTVEKREAQLCAALSASTGEPTAGGCAANRLQVRKAGSGRTVLYASRPVMSRCS